MNIESTIKIHVDFTVMQIIFKGKDSNERLVSPVNFFLRGGLQ
jgi:hypothetical protein